LARAAVLKQADNSLGSRWMVGLLRSKWAGGTGLVLQQVGKGQAAETAGVTTEEGPAREGRIQIR